MAAYVDVDGLKAVNDKHGHHAGDQLLQDVSRGLRRHMRSYDLLMRLGGDEFLCVLPGVTVDEARRRLECLGAELCAAPGARSISVGLAELRDGDGPRELIERADQDLLSGRDRGRRGIRVNLAAVPVSACEELDAMAASLQAMQGELGQMAQTLSAARTDLAAAEQRLQRNLRQQAAIAGLRRLALDGYDLRALVENAADIGEQALAGDRSSAYPGAVIRLNPGANPPETALAEVFEPPMKGGVPVEGFSPRGMDIDRNGVAWVAMASGHMASFDRRKCKGPLNGPNATGQHCAEGWTFYTEPLPQMKGVTTSGSAESSYYTWVDQFDTLGLGANTPINTGNHSEGLLALKDGKWVVLRVPYPTGFFTKWMDGRIDDPKGGWKGRGLWATVSTRAPFHMETGKGTTSKVVHFQMRPDPLAR